MSDELGPLYERLGELSGLMKGVNVSLLEMKEDHTLVREKITEVEAHVASLNSVEKKLSHLGIDYSEANDFRELLSWVRKRKSSIESRNQQIMKTILTSAVTGACVVLAGYVWVGFQKDINVNNQTIQQAPNNGNVRTDLPGRRPTLSNSGTTRQP